MVDSIQIISSGCFVLVAVPLLCLPFFLRFVPSVCVCISSLSLSLTASRCVLVPFYLLYYSSVCLPVSPFACYGAEQTIGVRKTEQTSDLPLSFTKTSVVYIDDLLLYSELFRSDMSASLSLSLNSSMNNGSMPLKGNQSQIPPPTTTSSSIRHADQDTSLDLTDVSILSVGLRHYQQHDPSMMTDDDDDQEVVRNLREDLFSQSIF